MHRGLTVSGFDLLGVPPGEALQVWRRSVPTHEVLRYDPPTGEDEADWATAWLLDRIILSPCAIHSLHECRSAERIAADGIDHYSVVICESGSWTGWYANTSFRATAGNALVIDMGQPLELQIEHSRAVQVIVPRAMLASDVTIRALHGTMMDGAVADVFIGMVRTIVSRLPHFTASDAGPLCKVLCELLNTTLAPGGPAADKDAANLSLRERARRAVLSQVSDPALSPGALARMLGVSRTRLYETLRPAGGVAVFIQQTRLRAAHTMLLQRHGHLTVRQAGAATGFVNPAHFSRLFHSYFGIRPRDLLTVQHPITQARAAALPGESPWSTWIRRLGQ